MKTTVSQKPQSHQEIAKVLAVTLLKQKRKISYAEIEALSSITGSENDADEIVDYLINTMQAKKSLIKKSNYPVLAWDTILTIN